MDFLIELDHELFLFLNNLGNETWDGFWLAVTNKWTAIPLYIVLIYLIFRKFGWKNALMTLILVALLITCTDQLGNIFKGGFKRFRPCGQEGVKEYVRLVAAYCGKYGYFSAHASNSFGVAVFLGLLFKNQYPKLIYFLLIWALLVAYSRIYLGVHYPGDIITGGILGAGIGYAFYELHTWFCEKYFTKHNRGIEN